MQSARETTEAFHVAKQFGTSQINNMAGKGKKREIVKDDGASNGPPKRQKLEEKTTDKNVKQQKGSRSEEFDKYDADIEGKLMLKMPDDLYWFWEFCKDISSSSPKDAFKESLGLVLTGPFDILNGSFEDADDSKLDSIHLHSRFYYDPPEFMTLVKEDTFTEGFHIGYFRDDPNNMPSFLASNSSNDGYEFTICGETIFAAVNISINDKLRTIKDKMRIKEVKELQTKLQSFAKEKRYRLDPVTASIKARNKNMVTKSFHKLGIVVPVVNDVGYRELPYTDSQLKKLLKEIADTRNESAKEKAFEDIQEVITLIQFANDECDYGMGLELGIDLFCFGNEMLHGPIMSLLPLAYQLLGKQLYAEIIEKHINKRSLESLDLCKVPRKNNAASNWH